MKKIIHNKFAKWSCLAASSLIVVLLLLHMVNYFRLGYALFGEEVQALIARSRVIKDKAGPDYQAEVLAKLPPNPNNGAFLRLDDSLSEAILRGKPSMRLQKDVSKVIFSFEFDDPGKPGLIPALGRSDSQVKNGVLQVLQKDHDYLTTDMPIQIAKDDIADIVIRARVNKGTTMTIAWHSTSNLPDTSEFLWRQRVGINLIADDDFHTYVINAKNILKRTLITGQEIKNLLLRPSDIDGSVVCIDFIRFISKRAKYWGRPNGTGYEIVGKEMRRVLYMLLPQTLEYVLQVPERSPTLDFGNAILIDDEPINFEVSIENDDGMVRIYTNRLTSASKWHDVRLDLSQWAGKEVRLTLRVFGSQNNVAFWSNPFLSSEPREHFNVIVILEDALRADHLSAHGYKLLSSPFRDSLLERYGIVFLNAISQATWTRASVPSLMTSLCPSATGVWNLSDILSDEYLTIAEIMRSQGFVTSSFIQNPNAGPWAGNHQGFSQIFDSLTLRHDSEEIFGDRLAVWLEHNRHRNFFLYLHVQDPHGPYKPPVPFDRWYREAPGETGVKRSYLDPEWVEHPTLEGRRLLYDGEILHNDAQLSKFIEKLRAMELFETTLLVFISDHGEHLGEHGLWDHRPPGFIQTIHVPLHLVYPARFRRSKRILQTAQLIDVMPTVLELARVDTSNLLLQGDSLVDLIEGRRLSYWENRISVSEEPYDMSSRFKKKPHVCGSLFYRNWHLISSKSLFRGSWRLPPLLRMGVFDFKNDSDETRMSAVFFPDLYLKYKFARIVTELQSNNIAAWRKWTGGHKQNYKLDPDRLERLRSLGYIE